MTATDGAFWSDDFDMDLLKVIPDVEQMLGELADVELYTHGKTTNGRLNHPSVWNSYHAMIAFFGFEDPGKPEAYHTSDLVVRCTFLEALRDAWVHSYEIFVEGISIWNAFALKPEFDRLMYHIRSWRSLHESEATVIRQRVLKSIASTARPMLLMLVARAEQELEEIERREASE